MYTWSGNKKELYLSITMWYLRTVNTDLGGFTWIHRARDILHGDFQGQDPHISALQNTHSTGDADKKVSPTLTQLYR